MKRAWEHKCEYAQEKHVQHLGDGSGDLWSAVGSGDLCGEGCFVGEACSVIGICDSGSDDGM
ncbi:hypothetical protein A2U01_0045886, partial [Trifolium medium]|nr:hypothetical protein [Trifolium medium]